jgi:hypothetical protein
MDRYPDQHLHQAQPIHCAWTRRHFGRDRGGSRNGWIDAWAAAVCKAAILGLGGVCLFGEREVQRHRRGRACMEGACLRLEGLPRFVVGMRVCKGPRRHRMGDGPGPRVRTCGRRRGCSLQACLLSSVGSLCQWKHGSVLDHCRRVHDAAGSFWSVLHEYEHASRLAGAPARHVTHPAQPPPQSTSSRLCCHEQHNCQRRAMLVEGRSPHLWAAAAVAADDDDDGVVVVVVVVLLIMGT